MEAQSFIVPSRQAMPPQYASFALALVKLGCPEAAAISAGYDPSHGRKLERIPAIVEYVRAEVQRRLQVEGAPLGLRVLTEIARDTKAPAGVRVDCAKTLLSRGGHVEPKAAESQAGEKDLSDMSQDELLGVINQCEGELGKRATPVNAPSGAVIDAISPQVIDIFE